VPITHRNLTNHKFNASHAIIKALRETKGIHVIQSPSILQATHSHNFKPMTFRNNDYIICRKLRIFLLSVCGNKKTQDNQYLKVSQDKNCMDVKLAAIKRYKKQ
jgi:hypothetical protein